MQDLDDQLQVVVQILKTKGYLRTNRQLQTLKNYLIKQQNSFCSELLLSIGDELFQKFMKVLKVESFTEDQVVLNYGEFGTKFYIILEGKVAVQIPKDPDLGYQYLQKLKNKEKRKQFLSQQRKKMQNQKGLYSKRVVYYEEEDEEDTTLLKFPKMEFYCSNYINQGSAFGEYALNNNAQRTATIKCVVPNNYLAVLEKEDYIQLVQKVIIKQNREKVQFILELGFFNS